MWVSKRFHPFTLPHYAHITRGMLGTGSEKTKITCSLTHTLCSTGDRINITNPQMEESELVVKHISLMYTIFNRVDNEAIVQIPRKISFSLSPFLITSHRKGKPNRKRSRIN